MNSKRNRRDGSALLKPPKPCGTASNPPSPITKRFYSAPNNKGTGHAMNCYVALPPSEGHQLRGESYIAYMHGWCLYHDQHREPATEPA